jgi:hypothetical protein
MRKLSSSRPKADASSPSAAAGTGATRKLSSQRLAMGAFRLIERDVVVLEAAGIAEPNVKKR